MISGERVRERYRCCTFCLFLQLWPRHFFITSHIKVSSLIFSTVDIVISPTEVIHHQCNITPSPCLSFSCFIFIPTAASWSLAPQSSLSPFLLFQPSLCNFLFLSALRHFLSFYIQRFLCDLSQSQVI